MVIATSYGNDTATVIEVPLCLTTVGWVRQRTISRILDLSLGLEER